MGAYVCVAGATATGATTVLVGAAVELAVTVAGPASAMSASNPNIPAVNICLNGKTLIIILSSHCALTANECSWGKLLSASRGSDPLAHGSTTRKYCWRLVSGAVNNKGSPVPVTWS